MARAGISAGCPGQSFTQQESLFPDISKLDLLLRPKGKAKGLYLSLLLGHQFYHKGARTDLRITER